VGSFFKNPIVSDKILSSILTKDPGVAYHSDGINKISAGSLIEHCGAKGIRVGNVGVSEKHALVIVNYGNATGEDIYNFSNYIGDKVFSKFGIELEPEVVFVKKLSGVIILSYFNRHLANSNTSSPNSFRDLLILFV